jgi:FkbM family methyltransferase
MLDGYYEKDLLAAMVELVPDKTGTFLDIGANIGNHSIYLSKHFRRVISFEPVPRNCWVFKANRHLNRAHNITLVEKGLSSKPGQLYFGCEDPMQTNTGLHESKNGSEDEEIAEVVLGDDALQALGLSNVVGVKIDVEGHEPEVIRGLDITLQTNHPVVFWEAFSLIDATRSVESLKRLGYRYFYHLGLKSSSAMHYFPLRLHKRLPELMPLDHKVIFSGLNVASVDVLRINNTLSPL